MTTHCEAAGHAEPTSGPVQTLNTTADQLNQLVGKTVTVMLNGGVFNGKLQHSTYITGRFGMAFKDEDLTIVCACWFEPDKVTKITSAPNTIIWLK